MLVGSILFPLTALASLETVRLGMMDAASWCFLAMGFSGLLLNVAGLPMALRLAPKEHSSETLSLLFATWAAACKEASEVPIADTGAGVRGEQRVCFPSCVHSRKR